MTRAQRFFGRHVIVSGGAQGAGAAASRLFAAEGARVSILDIAQGSALILEAELRGKGADVNAYPVDVAQPAALERAIAKASESNGVPDILFNHAGVMIVRPLHETSLADWKRLFDINVHSMFVATKAVVPAMLARGSGTIVNTSSVSAYLATPMEAAYCATKAACDMFTKAVATEYRDYGIRCNAVAPGFVATDHGLREIELLRGYGVNVQERDIADMQGRLCQPEEIAEVVLFLASDAASFINGEVVFADNTMRART